MEDLVAEALSEGERSGEVAGGLDARAAARSIVNALYGIALLKKIDPRHPRLREAASAALRVVEA